MSKKTIFNTMILFVVNNSWNSYNIMSTVEREIQKIEAKIAAQTKKEFKEEEIQKFLKYCKVNYFINWSQGSTSSQ